jgi:hypothetical protein
LESLDEYIKYLIKQNDGFDVWMNNIQKIIIK